MAVDWDHICIYICIYITRYGQCPSKTGVGHYMAAGMISYGAKYSIMVCDYIPDIADKSTNENMRHYLSNIDFNDVIVVLVNVFYV